MIFAMSKLIGIRMSLFFIGFFCFFFFFFFFFFGGGGESSQHVILS